MLTETISLIAVVVMAWLLWREHRKRLAVEANWDMSIRYWVDTHEALLSRYTDLRFKYLRLTDRDEKGRFVKRERGEAA